MRASALPQGEREFSAGCVWRIMALWHDRRGRFSPLRAATLALLVGPVLALLYFAVTHQLGPRARTEAIHEMGLWAYRFLLLSLFITPLRSIGRYALLIDVRRMIGVASFLYIALHLVLYAADQMFDFGKVVSEIVLRYYLTIGFTAWLGLFALALTSNNYSVRHLGGIRWRQWHLLVYPIAVLGSIHYFMQSKLQVFEPTVMGGIFLWLMLYRVLHWAYPRNSEFPLWVIAGTWFAVGAFTFLAEAIAFWIAFRRPDRPRAGDGFQFPSRNPPGLVCLGRWRNRDRHRALADETGRFADAARLERGPIAPARTGPSRCAPLSLPLHDRPRPYPQFFHRRPYRPRQVDAGRPADPGLRRADRARDEGAGARFHGYRARARHHHQGADRAAELHGAKRRDLCAEPDGHAGPCGLRL